MVDATGGGYTESRIGARAGVSETIDASWLLDESNGDRHRG
jgi:hypothetical protein